MARFVLSPAARADLDGIWDYTIREWGEDQAERYTRDIQAACQGLAAGTRISRSAEAIRAGYRKAAVGAHMIYFRVPSDGTIDVVRILHQSMDAERRLR